MHIVTTFLLFFSVTQAVDAIKILQRPTVVEIMTIFSEDVFKLTDKLIKEPSTMLIDHGINYLEISADLDSAWSCEDGECRVNFVKAKKCI